MKVENYSLPQKGLALSFITVTVIICFLCLVSLYSLDNSLVAVDHLWEKNLTSKLTDACVLNLTAAGQLPKEIETTVLQLPSLHEKIEKLQEQFSDLRGEFLGGNLSVGGRELAGNFFELRKTSGKLGVCRS